MSDVFVDRKTGEQTAPSEFLENLRSLEEMVSRADEDIAGLKGDSRPRATRGSSSS